MPPSFHLMTYIICFSLSNSFPNLSSPLPSPPHWHLLISPDAQAFDIPRESSLSLVPRLLNQVSEKEKSIPAVSTLTPESSFCLQYLSQLPCKSHQCPANVSLSGFSSLGTVDNSFSMISIDHGDHFTFLVQDHC